MYEIWKITAAVHGIELLRVIVPDDIFPLKPWLMKAYADRNMVKEKKKEQLKHVLNLRS